MALGGTESNCVSRWRQSTCAKWKIDGLPLEQAVFAVLNASSSGRPSIFHFAHVLWRHRDTQLLSVPPRAIQRIVLPVLLFIGRILGKYRGSSWPGSPESCHGAPLVDANA